MIATSRRAGALALVLAMTLGACSGGSAASPTAQPPAATPAPTSQPVSAPPSSLAPGATPGIATEPPGVQLTQAWATATLVDVTTGETFRIADLVASGKVVFMETMAIWCSKCRQQQQTATEAFTTMDADRVVWIGLDVESTESAEALARYREQHGFPFVYAIADRELSRALADDFGDLILSPPSVNVVVIGTDGRVSAFRGQHSVEDIHQLAADHGA